MNVGDVSSVGTQSSVGVTLQKKQSEQDEKVASELISSTLQTAPVSNKQSSRILDITA